MKLQRLYSLIRQAIDDYELIEEGDHIAIGISGGKDSLTLLYALHGLKQFYPRKFQLSAITVDLGYENAKLEGAAFGEIQKLCDSFSIPYEIVSTEIGKILFETRKESNPCALCAKMRKGALNAAAIRMGCNKIAYAHHKDDVVETMMLSLLYEGRFNAFPPKTYLDQSELTVIRPMIYVEEADVIRFKNRYELPVYKNPCPADGYTKRTYVKNLIRQLEKDNKEVKEHFFGAIANGTIAGWNKNQK